MDKRDIGLRDVFSLPPGRSLDICVKLQSAILEHRLVPGAKLSEDEVGEIFGASRTIVRTALQALAHTGMVEIKRNRGAFVAEPSVRDAHEVFEARSIVEPEVAKRAALKISSAGIKKLREHIDAEHHALKVGDMGQALALSGVFHTSIAAMADHDIYAQMVRSLIAQSSLIIALYWNRPDTACESHSHEALLEAFANKNATAAQDIMRSHIVDLHSGLDLKPQPRTDTSLAAALS